MYRPELSSYDLDQHLDDCIEATDREPISNEDRGEQVTEMVARFARTFENNVLEVE